MMEFSTLSLFVALLLLVSFWILKLVRAKKKNGMNFSNEEYEIQKWILKSRPKPQDGLRPSDISLESCKIIPSTDLSPGEALVKVEMLSVDAFVRTTLDEGAYHGSLELGSTLPALGYGVVVAVSKSKQNSFKIGQKIGGLLQASNYAVVKKGFTAPYLCLPGVSEKAGLHLLGLTTGMTAWVGINVVLGPPKKDQLVVVSAAAGAVGSIAAQLARNKGAKVIGIAGGDEKTKYLKEELGLYGAVDYKDSSKTIGEQLDQLLGGKQIDFFFDNVGGEVLDTVLERIAEKGRVIICGAISQYDSGNINRPKAVQGPSNYLKLAERGCTMSGFNVIQKAHWLPYGLFRLWIMILRGRLTINEHIVDGSIGSFGKALIGLFEGANIGKTLIPIDNEQKNAPAS